MDSTTILNNSLKGENRVKSLFLGWFRNTTSSCLIILFGSLPDWEPVYKEDQKW